MLKPACRWLDAPDGSYLYWNYRCVAHVKPAGGHVLTTITWGGRRHLGRAATLEQGKRWVERWVWVQKGPPGEPRRERRAV